MKNIRNYAFWALDYLKGSPIRNHLKEIKTIYYNKEGAVELQQKLLFEILEYAVRNTTYYSKYSPSVLSSFPVINKATILSNMDRMFSEEYKDKKDKLKVMTTSGSSGTPFNIFQNKGKVNRNKADLLFFYEQGGYYVGDRMYYMRIWNALNRKTKKELFKENFRMIDTSDLDAKGAKDFIKAMTSDKNEKVLLGYGSSYTALMEYLNKEDNIDWQIKAIFSSAEELPNQVKESMQEVFHCPIMSRYSNQENGILGQQLISGEDYFALNLFSYHIEFLKLDADLPAEEMEEARIVITDLFNKAVPMIRYDTGDIGAFSYITDKKTGKQKVLHCIQGRKNDYLYSNDKKRLSPHAFSNLMWEYNCFKQFQLIQEDYDKVNLKLVYKEGEAKNGVEKRLALDLKNIFGNTTQLNIEELEDIPIASSGKRKYIISKIDK